MSKSIISTSISMVESKLPPGFRFHPRDEELVSDYLFHKVLLHSSSSSSSSPHSQSNSSLLFIEVDLNKSEPWEIPESACVGGKEWYFYSQRDRKYATGLRTNRATASGYWKATGKDRPIFRKGGGSGGGGGGGSALVGMRKTLVFYQGRAPKGRKTDWVMHEFRLEGSLAPKLSSLKEDWVLCRVFYKSREAKLGSNNTITSMGMSTPSNSLPTLMDAYIRFDHQSKPPPYSSSRQFLDHHDHDDHHQQQVSCFSNNINYQSTHDLIMPNLQTFTTTNNNSAEAKVLGGFGSAVLDPFSGENENEVLKSFLNQLTNMETDPHFNVGCTGEESSDIYNINLSDFKTCDKYKFCP